MKNESKKWMKLMQNELFIDEIWAKIVVGTLSYRWNSILAVGSQIGSNLAVGSLYNRWNRIWVVGSTRAWFGSSDHAGERSDISPKNRQYIAEKSTINWRHRRFSIKIVDLSCFANISVIYCRFFVKYPSFDFFSWNVVSPTPDTRYIDDISPIFCHIFLLACIQSRIWSIGNFRSILV